MEAKDFIINVGPNGTFRPSGLYQTLPEHIDAIFDRYEKDKVKKITIFFHGGLVSEKDGMATAIKMGKNIEEAGQMPICFVWETGLKETIATNITKISDTKLFNKLTKVLIKKLSEKLGFGSGSGRGAGESLTDAEIEMAFLKEKPFESYNQDTLTTSGRGAGTVTSMPINEDELLQSLEADFTYVVQSDLEFTDTIANTKISADVTNFDGGRGIISTGLFVKHLALIAFRVIKRFFDKRDHDFYPTIIEEILRGLYIAELGAWVWNSMKVKSDEMWNDNTSLSGLNQMAGRYFLDKLIAYSNNNSDVEINLVGHSAGSIAICNMVKAVAKIDSTVVFNKIIFMAPACRVDLFNKEIVLNPSRFKQFRMFTMKDEFETQDKLVPFLYPYSLLYLVSGVLEDEGNDCDAYILGLERHINGKAPYNSAQELVSTTKFLFEGNTNRVIYSKSDLAAVLGLRTTSISHGEFDDNSDVIESINYFLKQV